MEGNCPKDLAHPMAHKRIARWYYLKLTDCTISNIRSSNMNCSLNHNTWNIAKFLELLMRFNLPLGTQLVAQSPRSPFLFFLVLQLGGTDKLSTKCTSQNLFAYIIYYFYRPQDVDWHHILKQCVIYLLSCIYEWCFLIVIPVFFFFFPI